MIHSSFASILLALLLLVLNGSNATASNIRTALDLPGTFVPFSRLSECPKLQKHRPTSARDVRPDAFSVVIALGDSITAGLFAKGHRSELTTYPTSDFPASQAQAPLGTDARLSLSLNLAEYRGLSYPIGGDEGAITLPNILGRWSNVTGTSKGHHAPLRCLDLHGIFPVHQYNEGIGGEGKVEERNADVNKDAGMTADLDQGQGQGQGNEMWRETNLLSSCLPHPESDGLNAAVSGSTSASLLAQVKDHIIPTIQRLAIKDEEWKYVNIGIGANDVCAFCLTPNVTTPSGEAVILAGSPQDFALNIKMAVEELRASVPNIIVNIIGVLRVSAIYKLTLKDPYCQPLLPLPIPHLALECSCALLPGPAGDITRKKMDELGEAYDAAVLDLIGEWEKEEDPHFGVIWQPGTVVDLPSYPITALSPIDCFHPSQASHERVAAGFWNRLALSWEEKNVPVAWEEDEPTIRCLEEGDRIPVGMVSERNRGRGE